MHELHTEQKKIKCFIEYLQNSQSRTAPLKSTDLQKKTLCPGCFAIFYGYELHFKRAAFPGRHILWKGILIDF